MTILLLYSVMGALVGAYVLGQLHESGQHVGLLGWLVAAGFALLWPLALWVWTHGWWDRRTGWR